MRIEKQTDEFYGDVWVLFGDTEIIGRYLSEAEAVRIKTVIEVQSPKPKQLSKPSIEV